MHVVPLRSATKREARGNELFAAAAVVTSLAVLCMGLCCNEEISARVSECSSRDDEVPGGNPYRYVGHPPTFPSPFPHHISQPQKIPPSNSHEKPH
jgi:hypothetical protein